MAAYGAQIQQGKSEAEAEDYLKRLFDNVAVQDKSAREALQTFTGGKGDVLIAYENEAITAQQKGEDVDYVVPDETILIENPIAVTTDAKDGAKEFVDFTRSDEAQKIFAEKGYRSVNPELVDAKKYPKPSGLFEIDKFGGWSAVNDEVLRARRHRREDRGGPWRLHGLAPSTPACPPTPPAHRRRGRRALPERHRAAAAGRGDGEGVRGRDRRVLGAGHPAAGGRGAQADARASRWPSRAINIVAGHADRLGARARRVPRQELREHADRPAVRAADDRGRADAAGALRRAVAGRHRRRLHARRAWRWRCCS